MTLTWEPVEGAVGYQVYAADAADGPFEPLDHAGRDVLAVPHPPYADTTGTPGVPRWYAVATLSDVHVEGPRSAAVEATPLAEPGGAGARRRRRRHRGPRRCPGRGGR